MYKTYKNKKIFITGHTGFKGSWFSLLMLKLGAIVDGYSLKPNTQPNHFDLLNMKLNKNYISDVNDYDSLEKALIESNPDIIYHLAAQPLVRYGYKNPLETFKTNIIGTANVLEASKKLKKLKAIVVITTDKVYDNKEWFWGYKESDRLGGYDPYSSSKACAELIINSYRNSYFNINAYKKTHQVLLASARAGNVIGGGDWSVDRLIPDIVKATVCNQVVKIRNPSSIRPWQHVLEPLYGYAILGRQLLEGNIACATSFNFGPENHENLSVYEVVKLAQERWKEIKFEFNQDKVFPHEANMLMLDISKAKNILKYKPIICQRKSIDNTIKWYKKYYQDGVVNTQNEIEQFLELV